MGNGLTQDDVNKLNDDQKSAVFDALITAAWADGSVTVAEMQLFQREVGKLDWGKSQQELMNMIDASKARLAALSDRDSIVAFIKGIAARVTDQGIRERVLYEMTLLMATDKKFDIGEQNVVGGFVRAFAISKERFDAITSG